MDKNWQEKTNNLTIIVRDRSGIVFEGEADSLSSINERGPFDVLPMHANFLSLIHTQLTLRSTGTVVKDLPITSGLVKVAGNAVEVYLGVVRSGKPRPFLKERGKEKNAA